jgi:hypothetical protein
MWEEEAATLFDIPALHWAGMSEENLEDSQDIFLLPMNTVIWIC